METLLFQLLNGLTLGTVLFLIAVGLSIILGVLGILNFAHGALYMVGAYLAFHVTRLWGLSFWHALLLAPLAVAVLGGLLERIFFRRIYSAPVTLQLLLTYAFLLILNDVTRIVWGADYRVVEPPARLAGTVAIGGGTYPAYSLAVIAFGPVVALALWLFLQRTRAGRIIRAATQDREMTGALGVAVPRLFTGVFTGGAWLAGLGGVLAAPIRTITPAMGDQIIIESFIVTVVGGLGSFPGALAGAVLLGLLQSFGLLLAPGAEMAFAYILMALVLIFRPWGLWGEAQA